MADRKRKALLFYVLERRIKEQFMVRNIILYAISRRNMLLRICLMVFILIISLKKRNCVRSCRRLERNLGWFNFLWTNYSDKRFKKTFRISRETFRFILHQVKHTLERETVTEEAITPECRLAIGLYRLSRGDYFYTIAEMAGLGVSTVCTIANEVAVAIVNNIWEPSVGRHMPKCEEDFKRKILDMEQMWQFPYCWSAIDGCHIPIKCPPGGAEAQKEYHNFKNFYSVVVMAMVDAHSRFIWGTCGFPGNSHDSIILQSTQLWKNITENNLIPCIGQDVNGANVPPLILGDSAFPLSPWLMKPYTNAILTVQQRYFNYRLSRARMVTEGAFGQLKSRWRVLLRKCDSTSQTVRNATLACMVLHNVCIERRDTISKKQDLTLDPFTNGKRPRAEIRELLKMRRCENIRDKSAQGVIIRNALASKADAGEDKW